jgi:hypothetical protein
MIMTKEQIIASDGEAMERLEVSDTAAGNVMWSTDFGDH